MLLYLCNTIIRFFPESRFFALKNMMWRICGLKIGRGTRICSSVVFHTNNLVIGDGVWIGPGCRFIVASETTCTIGDRVDIAMECLFVSSSHYLGDFRRRAGAAQKLNIEVQDGVWIGARSIVMGGSKLGEGVVVAASSFCNAEVLANHMVGGAPARTIKVLDD